MITVLDLGSLHGFSSIWDSLQENIELVGVDPFEPEGVRLGKYGRKEIVFNCLVGDKDEDNVVFNIAENGHASSLLEVNEKLVSRFHQYSYGRIIKKENVEVKEIKKLLEEREVKKFDFLKIDIEGSELKVLKNLEEILRKDCLGIEIECFFQEYHLGRPLFSDIETYLRSLGYYVFDIALEKWGRINNPIPYPIDHHGNQNGGNAQVMWGNSLFFKDPINDHDSLTSEQIEKLISLTKIFNQYDFSNELKTYFNL